VLGIEVGTSHMLSTCATTSYTPAPGSYNLNYNFSWCIDAKLMGRPRSRGRKRTDEALLSLRSFPKQIHFIWLFGYVFEDILLSKTEEAAAKLWFTLLG
jgi:hypothetical protein